MQGSVIGILVVFVFLCVAIIVILLRRRHRDEGKRELVEDSFQKVQYSRDDHLFEVRFFSYIVRLDRRIKKVTEEICKRN